MAAPEGYRVPFSCFSTNTNRHPRFIIHHLIHSTDKWKKEKQAQTELSYYGLYLLNHLRRTVFHNQRCGLYPRTCRPCRRSIWAGTAWCPLCRCSTRACHVSIAERSPYFQVQHPAMLLTVSFPGGSSRRPGSVCQEPPAFGWQRVFHLRPHRWRFCPVTGLRPALQSWLEP